MTLRATFWCVHAYLLMFIHWCIYVYVAGRAGKEPGSDQEGMLRGSGVLAQVLFCAHVCDEGKRSLKVDLMKCSVMLVRRWDVRAICWCTRAETHMKQLIEPCA